jgi:hypothetical protein
VSSAGQLEMVGDLSRLLTMEEDMCLDKIDMRFKKSDRVGGIGYKVFRVDHTGGLVSEFIDSKNHLPVRRWIHEKNFRQFGGYYNYNGGYYREGQIYSDDAGKPYPTGWHIFHSRSAAHRYMKHHSVYGVMRRVAYRDVRTIGTQFRKTVIVAKEIFIFGKKSDK